MTTDPTRLARAVHLDVERLPSGGWRVTGGTDDHTVSADASRCDCADFTVRRATCKHRLAVRLRQGDGDTLRGLREIVSMPRRRAR